MSLPSSAASAAQRPRPLLPGGTSLSDAMQALQVFASKNPLNVTSMQPRRPAAGLRSGKSDYRMTGSRHCVGRAGGWNSEAMLRLARENPRLHAALLKTHAGADRMSPDDAPKQQLASVPASPAQVGVKALAPTTAPAAAMPASPAVQSATGPSARVSGGSQTDRAAALRPDPQPSRLESASQTQPRMDPTDGSCSPGNGTSLGTGRVPGSPAVRFSLRVSQDASPNSSSCRSATMLQVPFAAQNASLGSLKTACLAVTAHVQRVGRRPQHGFWHSLPDPPASSEPAPCHILLKIPLPVVSRPQHTVDTLCRV